MNQEVKLTVAEGKGKTELDFLNVMQSRSVGEDSGQSKQITEDPFGKGFYTSGEVAVPPFSLETLAFMPEKSSTLSACIEAMAQNVVGLGWYLKVKDEFKEDSPQVKKEKELLERILKKPNPRMSFYDLIKLVKKDEETVGGGYIELARGNDGEIKLYHAPGMSIRIRKDKVLEGGTVRQQGFVQMVGQKKVYFKIFGDDRAMDKNTGELSKDGLGPDLRANELIDFTLYSTRERYYGIPRWVSASLAIAGTRWAEEDNAGFFKNKCIPSYVLFIEGGYLGKEAEEGFKQFMSSEFGGPENAHRVLVLSVSRPREGAGEMAPAVETGEQEKPVKFELKELVKRDELGFDKYEKRNENRIRSCFRLHPIFTGETENVNKAVAQTARILAEEQVFDPERKRYENRINNTILSALNIETLIFKFNRLGVADSLEKAREQNLRSEAGELTIDDMRSESGLRRLDTVWSRNIPFGLVKILALQGLIDINLEEEGKAALPELRAKLIEAVQKENLIPFLWDPGNQKAMRLNGSQFFNLVNKMRESFNKKIGIKD